MEWFLILCGLGVLLWIGVIIFSQATLRGTVMTFRLPPIEQSKLHEYLEMGSARNGPNGPEARAAASALLLSLFALHKSSIKNAPIENPEVKPILLSQLEELYRCFRLFLSTDPTLHQTKSPGEKSPFQLAMDFLLEDIEAGKRAN